jgi:ribonuclease HI|tara:strand:+ start:6037 stop:6735 length:699 start_codon:yes stop_codon:yes gene_type:complete
MDTLVLQTILQDISKTYNISFTELKEKYLNSDTRTRLKPRHKLPSTSINTNISSSKRTKDTTEIIFTDGSCINNGKRNAYGGVGVYFGKNDTRNYSMAQTKTPSNQKGELVGILKALELSRLPNVIIYTDSRYSMKCVTSGKNGWIDNWKKTNSNPKLWKNSKGKSVKHAEIIAQIDSLKKTKQSVELRHVNSHQSEPIDKNSQKYFIWYGNDQADKLAKIGSDLYKKQKQR